MMLQAHIYSKIRLVSLNPHMNALAGIRLRDQMCSGPPALSRGLRRLLVELLVLDVH